MYSGKLMKGLSLAAIPYLALVVAGLLLDLSLPIYFYGLALCLMIWYLYSFISSILLAAKNKKYMLRKFNRWYFYIIFYLLSALVSTTIAKHKTDLLGFNTFRIPSKSMHPTLQVGDYITATTNTKELDVGDIVIFRYPPKPAILYTFRVAAVAGDTISIDKGVVTRNGQAEIFPFPIENEAAFARQASFPETTIPDGEIFVLGDNRASSNDSRFWGNVKTSDVVGTVRYVWYSKDKSRIGWKVK